jgi:hypothetical protein
VVELGDVGDRLEPLLEVLTLAKLYSYKPKMADMIATHGNLLEVVSKLDNWGTAELS